MKFRADISGPLNAGADLPCARMREKSREVDQPVGLNKNVEQIEHPVTTADLLFYHLIRAWALPLALPIERRAHNCYYGPCTFDARKGMLQRFIFVNFSKGRYQGALA